MFFRLPISASQKTSQPQLQLTTSTSRRVVAGSAAEVLWNSFALCPGCGDSFPGADIVFVLDASGSIGAANYQLIRNFVRDTVNAFDIGLGPRQTRVGVITFGTFVRQEISLNSHASKAEKLLAISRIG